MNIIKAETGLKTDSFPIALVLSTFNKDITSALLDGALARLQELGFEASHITVVEVPGAVEIPFIANRLAKRGEVQAIIALGAVVRGETSHYDYVCDQVSQGCQRVMLDHDIPVIFGVLTTENDDQAWDRLGGKHGHKGREAVDCAVEMRTLGRYFS